MALVLVQTFLAGIVSSSENTTDSNYDGFVNSSSGVTTDGGITLEELSTTAMADFNATDDVFTSGRNDSNSTLESGKPARCEILKDSDQPDFFHRVSREELRELLCLCWSYCPVYTTISPEALRQIEFEFYYVMSDRNRDRFLITTVVFSVLLLTGVTGNILTIICLSCWMKTKSSTFLFILSLACSDLLLLVITIPLKELEMFQVLREVLMGPACTATYYIRDVSLACSVLTLTIISFERFYAICYPLKAQYRCSTRRARILIVLAWAASAALCVPSIIVIRGIESKYSHVQQTFCGAIHENFNLVKFYFLHLLTVLYLVPVCIMVYTYSRSCIALYNSARSAKKMQGDGESKSGVEKSSNSTNGTHKQDDKDKSDASIKGRIRVLQMLVLMLIAFIVCWGPMLTYAVFKIFGYKIYSNEETWRFVFLTLASANSSVNPYFFIAMSSQFRKEFRKRFRRAFHMKPAEGDTTVISSSTASTRYNSSVVMTATSGKPYS